LSGAGQVDLLIAGVHDIPDLGVVSRPLGLAYAPIKVIHYFDDGSSQL